MISLLISSLVYYLRFRVCCFNMGDFYARLSKVRLNFKVIIMGIRKKTFLCGHKGKGQFCHKCKAVEKIKENRRKEQEIWNIKVNLCPVKVVHLPSKVTKKALELIENLSQGEGYHAFNGKRLADMGQREIISIPVGWSYRLICHEFEGHLKFIEVLTHENYNNRISSGGWKI